ncbi:AraC family transcriptional regulator [Inquilinus sp. CAU 1745]|uniref:AraC family transcriptional regulator n=1 Tax=Inquilinus sp. CAU 1745 TaxID=3140369 RepID=UPI00325B12CA
MRESGRTGLERSCGDWIRHAPAPPGLERMEAFFAGHAYAPHRHDTYAIGYTIEGVQSFDYRGVRADSRAGNAIIIHPDEVHDGRAGVETGFHYRMLYIEPRLIAGALDGRARSLPFAPDAVLADPRLIAALTPLLGDMERAPEPLEADAALARLADALLSLDASAGGGGFSMTMAARAVETARAFLDAHFDRIVASEELEEVTGLDRFTLARHFRARLGTSPYRYLTMRRLDRVRSRLRAGHGLADAAAESGFSDQSHMTRQFKRAYGIPPGRWQAIHAAPRPVYEPPLPMNA